MKSAVLVTLVTMLLAGLILNSSEQTVSSDTHLRWVESALKDMESVSAGMTREQLQRVFTTEGGISNPSERRYVYKGCPLFKVQVEFQTRKSSEGRPLESPDDVIIKISKPFLERTIVD